MKKVKKQGSTVILLRDDNRSEVFLVFRSDYPLWGTTGGGIEAGETPKEAAIREAFEETGFQVEIINYMGLYKREDNRCIYESYLFEGRVLSGQFKPEFPGCKGRWFSIDKLPLSILDRTREKILDCRKSRLKPFKKPGRTLLLKNNLHLLVLHPIAAAKYVVKQVVLG